MNWDPSIRLLVGGRVIVFKNSELIYLFPCRMPAIQSKSNLFSFGKWKKLW